jgi:protein-S-isoprenylcysteine O-methyltransferase Ste14
VLPPIRANFSGYGRLKAQEFTENGTRRLCKLISDKNEFDTSGILGITRHPWYLAAILLIWARPLDISVIVVNMIFTAYLIAGTYLEEKKLIREFGDKYRIYQQQVSMLIPLKCFSLKLI